MGLGIIIVFLLLVLILSTVFNMLILKKYKKIENDTRKIIQTIKRVRYGDINIRTENLNNKELESSINRLLETICDRESMIIEYQTTLSDKNISLQKIINNEKQLQLFKEEFAATLTHDMKVPIIAELNSINYLLEGRFGKLNDKQTEVLTLMNASNNELKDLIDNMLETYRLEQKELVLNKQNYNFNEFINEIIQEMSPIISVSGHKIIADTKKTQGVMVHFDEMQLKRVIKNLIQNAVSYSPNKSVINIDTNIEQNKIKFKITNEGEILSEKDLKNIFEKYYSQHSKFKKAGTGLGLYLSEKIMLAHNGNIDVNTDKKGYTSFVLTFPI